MTTDPDNLVRATYEIETALELEAVADAMANEQSCGTFVRVAGETAELRDRYGAVVNQILELPPSGLEPLPGAGGDWSKAKRARVSIDFPLDNFGTSIPNMLAAVAGNLFELRDVGALRLVDLELPQAFADAYPGPRFGVAGTRKLVGRSEGPLIGTIIKPSIGLETEQLARLVSVLASADIDFIKDDELQGNAPKAPLEARVQAVMPVLRNHAERTGRLPMYAFNITDNLGQIVANHDVVRDAGGTCVMVCVNTVGLAGLEFLRQHCELPIHGHRTMFGAFSRSPQLGIDFQVFQKLSRLAGSDHVHTNGISNKFYESDAQVLRSIEAVRTPMLGGFEALPVLSSGQSAGLAHHTYASTGTTDLLVLAGGGIHGHPNGPADGVLAMREAWDAALIGESLDDRAATVPALDLAVQTFGRV